MELLVRVVHCEEFLDKVDDALRKKYPTGIESLMLEIPSNWQQFKYVFVPRDSFFIELAERYEKNGTRVIYGDIPINPAKPFSSLDLFIDLFTQKRSKAMLRKIHDENPQVAVLGDHADYIKRKFPEVYYIAFQVAPFDLSDLLIQKILGRPYKPDELIRLVHRFPKEYYLKKYRVIR